MAAVEQSERRSVIWSLPILGSIAGVLAALVNALCEAILAPALVDISAVAWLEVIAAYVLISGAVWLGAVAVALVCAGFRRVGLEFIARRPELVAGALSFAPLWMVGEQLATGGWVSQQSWAGAVPFGVAADGAVVLALVVRLARSRKYARVVTGLFAAAAVGIIAVDVVALPGLYPQLHFLLKLAAASGIAVALVRATEGIGLLNTWKSAVVGLALTGVASAGWLTMSMPVRVQLLLRGGAATDFVQHMHEAPEATHLARELNRLEKHRVPLADRAARPATQKPVQNVLFVFVDTLRADAIPPTRTNGYVTDADTPYLNEFLKQCHRFDHAYAQSSATHRSIPATFRSIQTWEYSSRNGTALGTAMASQGIHTTAVINNYFFEPRYSSSQGLLEGFDEVKVYDSYDQKKLLDFADATFDTLGDGRFFMWVHFFAMHSPGYYDKLLPRGTEPKKRYKRSLQWLDKSMKRLVGDLQKHGLADDTVIVLASDHGEGLGANNINVHGPTIFEEEIRVPLALCLPKKAQYAAPRVIETTVSNIDIVPTLTELLGLPLNPAHRGRSLAPLFRSASDDLPPQPVYFENANKRRVGIAAEQSKFIFHPKDEAFFHFDVSTDPTEEHNLYADSPADEELRHQMFRLNPRLLEDEAKRQENLGIILSHLREIDPDSPDTGDELVLALGGFTEHSDADEQAARIFRATKNPRLAFWVLRHFRGRDIASELTHERIEALRGTDEEAVFVELAASAGVGTFEEKWVQTHMTRLAPNDALWSAWLHMIGRWKKSGEGWGPTYLRLFKTAKASPQFSTQTLHRLLEAIASTRWKQPPAELQTLVRAYLADDRPLVRRSAIEAVGAMRDKHAYGQVRAAALGEGTGGRRIQQAAIHALAKIGGESVGADIEAAAKGDVFLAMDAFDALARLGEHEPILRLGKIHRRYVKDARKAAARAKKKKKK